MNEAVKYLQSAHELIAQGKYEDALVQSLKAVEISPVLLYLYQNAYIYTKLGENQKAINILSKLVESGEADELTYSLLGNNYAYINEPVQSINIYSKGLEKYPDSGFLYHELGISLMNEGNDTDALNCFITGIEKEPGNNVNYLSAGKSFIASSEMIWGFIYLDIFSMMGDTTGFYADVGSIMYKYYIKAFEAGKDKLSFFETEEDRMNGYEFDKEYEKYMNIGFSGTFDGSIKQISDMKTDFILNWFKDEMDKKFPNALFNAQKQLMDHGYFELTNYSVFRKINTDEFNEYVKNNKSLIEKYNEFNETEGIFLDLTKPILRGMYN